MSCLYTVGEVAKILACSEAKILSWLHEGLIDYLVLPATGNGQELYRIDRTELLRFVHSANPDKPKWRV